MRPKLPYANDGDPLSVTAMIGFASTINLPPARLAAAVHKHELQL
jgi:hypothetical protein